jgi:MFS superfamily sulfate permease-like transporter
MILGTLEGILAAVIVSMLEIMCHARRLPMYEVGRNPGTAVFRPRSDHPNDETFPSLLILHTEGRLYFG